MSNWRAISPSRRTCSISAAARSFPIALEGALKLKEISYLHAEGYAAGELKHGPIALVDENMPVIVIAPHDKVFEKTFSNMQEVAARGGRLILMTDAEGDARLRSPHDGHAHLADGASGSGADCLCGSGPAFGLSHRGVDGHGRRSAAQSGQIGDGGIIADPGARARRANRAGGVYILQLR